MSLSLQVRLAEDSGAQETEAALLISYLAIGSAIGRLTFGRMADCKQFNRFYVCQTGLLGISVSSTLVTMVTSYKWLVLYAVAFGLFEGCYVALNPVLIRDIVGADKYAYGLGMSFFVMSFTRSAGPPIAGWIYDSFQSYYAAFLYMGLVFVLGNCVAFVAQLFLEKSHRTEVEKGMRESAQLIIVVKETVV